MAPNLVKSRTFVKPKFDPKKDKCPGNARGSRAASLAIAFSTRAACVSSAIQAREPRALPALSKHASRVRSRR